MRPELILEVARCAGRTLKGPLPNGEYLMQCPFPENHRNGDAHPSCRLNPEKGVWMCDPCGRGGGIVDLAKALRVPVPWEKDTEPPRSHSSVRNTRRPLHFVQEGPMTEKLCSELATRLGKDHPMATWSAFGAVQGSVTPGGDLAVGFPQPSGGWLLVLHRRPDSKRDKPYSLRFADGGKADLLIVGLDRSGPVIICEGLWDAMQAYTDGFPVATATAGAGTWRDPWCITFQNRQVGVVYDVDRAGRDGSRRVLASLGMAGV